MRRFMNQCPAQGWPIDADPDWPSPCVIHQAGEQAWWRPWRLPEVADFANMEQALGLALHPDIKTYYGRYYADNINARAPQGKLQLLFAWNDDDFARLQQNLIGHILMKQRLKQDISLFFALADEDDLIISLDNATGAVQLEWPGKPAHRRLAPSLADFLAGLTPCQDD